MAAASVPVVAVVADDVPPPKTDRQFLYDIAREALMEDDAGTDVVAHYAVVVLPRCFYLPSKRFFVQGRSRAEALLSAMDYLVERGKIDDPPGSYGDYDFDRTKWERNCFDNMEDDDQPVVLMKLDSTAYDLETYTFHHVFDLPAPVFSPMVKACRD